MGHTELLVPSWGTQSPCPHPPSSLTPGQSYWWPWVCPALTFQPRAYACRISADRFICLYWFFCCGVTKGVSWVGLESQGERAGQGKHGQDLPCPHPVATEPGRDEDLALAHQLVLGPAPPAPKRFLDEGGELGHTFLALPLQVKELGTTTTSAVSLSSSRGFGITQELPG